jgi:hypothetical protein
MNCLFCDFELKKSENVWTGLECNQHPPIEVIFYPNEINTAIVDYYVMRNDQFEVSIYPNPPSTGSHDHVFYIAKTKGKYTTIFSSDKIPQIHPDKFLEKIKTLLMFI